MRHNTTDPAKSSIAPEDITALQAAAVRDVSEIINAESEQYANDAAYELEVEAVAALGFDGAHEDDAISDVAENAQTIYWLAMRDSLRAHKAELSPGALAYLALVETVNPLHRPES